MENQGFFSHSSSGFSATKDDDYKTNKNLMVELDFELFNVLFPCKSLSKSIGNDADHVHWFLCGDSFQDTFYFGFNFKIHSKSF
ncbi:hypothetical protein MKW92_000904 [Papaver armeniacum]|nr:hypothetical protein MKW92_000904 [Papaver armeniacum]